MPTKFNGDRLTCTASTRLLTFADPGTTSVTNLSIFNSDSITYDAGPPRKGDGRPLWKRCSHTGTRWKTPGGMGYRQPGLIEQTGAWPLLGTIQSRLDASLAAAINRLPSFSAAVTAFNSEMQGKLQASCMPLVDLVELWGMRKFFLRFMPNFHKANQEIEKRKLCHNGESWKDIIQTPPGRDLAFRFGIKPASDTITQIIWLHKTVADHVQKLKDRNDQFLPYKVTASGGKRKDVYKGTGVYMSSRKLGEVDYCIESCAATTIHARCQLNYNTNDALRLQFLFDAVGINSPLTMAWELVPWSFFYDYFVSIGDVIGQLDTWFFHGAPLERVVRIEELWYTESVSASLVDFKLNATGRTPGLEIIKCVPPCVNRCRFTRAPFEAAHLKTFLSMPELNGLGNQTVNHREVGLDLLIQSVL